MAFTYGFCVDKLGVDFSLTHTTQQHELGLKQRDSLGNVWVYVKAGEAIGAGDTVKAAASTTPYTSVLKGTASAAGTFVLGYAPAAIANASYGWILHKGVYPGDAVVVSGNVANGDPIVSDANADGDKAAATDINNAFGVVLVDDTDNTGTVIM